jgi:hypothetical protein
MLVVSVDGEAIVQYDRRITLPAQQRAYLDAMDRRMAQGIQPGSNRIEQPDELDRARFVAVQLSEALKSDNDALIAAACAWLANRIPELRQVKIENRERQRHIDLVFDRDYVKEVRVDLVTPKKPGGGGQA